MQPLTFSQWQATSPVKQLTGLTGEERLRGATSTEAGKTAAAASVFFSAGTLAASLPAASAIAEVPASASSVAGVAVSGVPPSEPAPSPGLEPMAIR